MATKVEQLRQAASQAADAFSAEMAKYNDDNLPTAEQAAVIDGMRTAMTTAASEAQAAEKFSAERLEHETREANRRNGNGGGNPAQRNDGDGRRQPMLSLGQRFVEGEKFKAWHGAHATAAGYIPDSMKKFNSGALLEFAGFRDLEPRSALITGASDTSGGAFIVNDQYPTLTELGRRPLTLRQIITNLQTGSDTVEYVRQTTETNAAAPVAEAVATSGGVGVKPESTLAYEKVTAVVKTVAHWIPATKRALSDASQLRGLIDAFLRYGLEEELEDQIMAGAGTGENFTGLLETSNTQAQAWDTDLFKTLRVAKRKVRTVGKRIPTAFVLNPEDWERAELAQDDVYRYYGQGPFGVTQPTIWGLPVVECEAIPAGTGMVGDFKMAVLWDREQATISVSDSHSDFFIRNLVAILAEMRAAFGVLKPNAFVEIDLTA